MFFSFLPSLPVSNFARPRQHDSTYSAQQHATWPSISHISPPSFRSTRSSAQRAAAPTLVGLPTVGLPTRWGLSSWPPPGTCCSRATRRPSCTSRFVVHRGRIAPANAFGRVVSSFYRVYVGTYNKDVVSRFFLPSPSYRATIARWRQRVGSSRYCKRRRPHHSYAFTGIAPRRRLADAQPHTGPGSGASHTITDACSPPLGVSVPLAGFSAHFAQKYRVFSAVFL